MGGWGGTEPFRYRRKTERTNLMTYPRSSKVITKYKRFVIFLISFVSFQPERKMKHIKMLKKVFIWGAWVA